MKTEIADKKLEILNWIFKSKDGASWNEVFEMLNEFERICKDEDHVIKAKALRKKGTDEWYFDFIDEIHKDKSWIGLIQSIMTANYYKGHLPPDAKLVDIEIRVIEPNK